MDGLAGPRRRGSWPSTSRSWTPPRRAPIPLVADARACLEELTAALDARGYAGVEHRAAGRQRARCAPTGTRRSTGSAHCPAPQHTSQPEAIRLVNEAAGRDGIVVCAAGGLPGDLHKLWRTSRPGGYHLEYGYSTMGYEVAGGIGVAMAEPDRRVYVMVGDGSWLMLSAEIATAVQEGIGLTVVLLDNHGFRCIRNLSSACGGEGTFQDFRFRDPATGQLTGDVLPIDFAANAASLGAHVLTAHDPAELASALEASKAITDRPVVIVTEVDPSVGVPGYDSWWDVPVAEVSDNPLVRQAYADYRGAPRHWSATCHDGGTASERHVMTARAAHRERALLLRGGRGGHRRRLDAGSRRDAGLDAGHRLCGHGARATRLPGRRDARHVSDWTGAACSSSVRSCPVTSAAPTARPRTVTGCATSCRSCATATPEGSTPFAVLCEAIDEPDRLRYSGRIDLHPEAQLDEVARAHAAGQPPSGRGAVPGAGVPGGRSTPTPAPTSRPTRRSSEWWRGSMRSLVGLCLDSGHFRYGGADPAQRVRDYRSVLQHVHLKDCHTQVLRDVRRDDQGLAEALARGVFTELGTGDSGIDRGGRGAPRRSATTAGWSWSRTGSWTSA